MFKREVYIYKNEIGDYYYLAKQKEEEDNDWFVGLYDISGASGVSELIESLPVFERDSILDALREWGVEESIIMLGLKCQLKEIRFQENELKEDVERSKKILYSQRKGGSGIITLVDVEDWEEEVTFGTCELCSYEMEVNLQKIIFKQDEETFSVCCYEWKYGELEEFFISAESIIPFAQYIKNQEIRNREYLRDNLDEIYSDFLEEREKGE